MSRVKRDWIASRQHWTRDEQKKRIMAWFKIRAEKGHFEAVTAQAVANGLRVISAQKIKEICEEMVLDRELDVTTAIHRVRKDGSRIVKSLYVPYCMDEWRNQWLEEDALARFGQPSLFDV